MKCPNCGAEISGGKFCEFCGTQLSAEMIKEQEQLNKQGCPKCGSTNVTFRRENSGEYQEKNKKVVVHKTIGLCKDCGNTWTTNDPQKKRKTWLWVLGWIFVFPLPLTLILLKKKKMKPVLKYGIIAVAWILYLIFVLSGNSSDKAAAEQADSSTEVSIIQQNLLTEDDEKADASSAVNSIQATKQTVQTEPETTTTTTTSRPTTTTTTTTTTSRPAATTTTTTTTSRPAATTTTTQPTTKATTVYIAPTTTTQPTTVAQQTSDYYVLNTNTMRIHYPSCSSVKDIFPENYAETDDFNAAIQNGYQPCGKCHPH